MSKYPYISVILSVYNAELYLAESIQSILNQSYRDFELLILNDGSTDRSEQIILSFNDPRIRYFKTESNKGLIFQLNKGILNAKGKYVARMDADDISSAKRFEKQITFLEENPAIKLVGSCAEVIDEKGKATGRIIDVPKTFEAIKAGILFQCPFIHSSVMGSAEVFKKFGYSDEFPIAEDYFLWSQITKVYRTANLSEVLLHYRTHPQNVSRETEKLKLKTESLRKLFGKLFTARDFPLSEKQISAHLHLYILPQEGTKNYQLVHDWLWKLQKSNQDEKFGKQKIFDKNLGDAWYYFCLRNTKSGLLPGYFLYLKSPFRKAISSKKSILLLFHTIGSYDSMAYFYEKIRNVLLPKIRLKF